MYSQFNHIIDQQRRAELARAAERAHLIADASLARRELTRARASRLDYLGRWITRGARRIATIRPTRPSTAPER